MALDAGSLRILEELRDLRVEMREDRRRSDERYEQARRESEERYEQGRRESEERYEQGRRESEERYEAGRRETNERFERALQEFREGVEREMRAFREDSARHAAETQKMFGEIRTVGYAIVRTLNRHTRLLERIDRKLGARDNGRPGRGNGRGA